MAWTWGLRKDRDGHENRCIKNSKNMIREIKENGRDDVMFVKRRIGKIDLDLEMGQIREKLAKWCRRSRGLGVNKALCQVRRFREINKLRNKLILLKRERRERFVD